MASLEETTEKLSKSTDKLSDAAKKLSAAAGADKPGATGAGATEEKREAEKLDRDRNNYLKTIAKAVGGDGAAADDDGKKKGFFGGIMKSFGAKVAGILKIFFLVTLIKSLFSPRAMLGLLKTIGKFLGPIAIILAIVAAVKGAIDSWFESDEESWTMKLTDALFGALGQIIEWFSFGFIKKEDVVAALLPVKEFFRKIGPWVEEQWVFLKTLLVTVWTDLTTWIGDIYQKIEDWFTDLWDWDWTAISTAWYDLTDWVGKIWQKIEGWFTGLWDWDFGGISTGWTNLTTFIKDKVWTPVKRWLDDLFSWPTGDAPLGEKLATKFIDIVYAPIDLAIRWIRSIFGWGARKQEGPPGTPSEIDEFKLSTFIIDQFKKVLVWFEKKWEWVSGGIVEGWTNVTTFIKDKVWTPIHTYFVDLFSWPEGDDNIVKKIATKFIDIVYAPVDLAIRWLRGLFGWGERTTGGPPGTAEIDEFKLSTFIMGKIEEIITWFEDKFGGVATFVAGWFDWFTNMPDHIYNAFIAPIVDWIKGIFGGGADEASEGRFRPASASFQGMDRFTNAFDWFDDIPNLIYDAVIGPVVEWIKEKIDVLTNLIPDIINDMTELFNDLLPDFLKSDTPEEKAEKERIEAAEEAAKAAQKAAEEAARNLAAMQEKMIAADIAMAEAAAEAAEERAAEALLVAKEAAAAADKTLDPFERMQKMGIYQAVHGWGSGESQLDRSKLERALAANQIGSAGIAAMLNDDDLSVEDTEYLKTLLKRSEKETQRHANPMAFQLAARENINALLNSSGTQDAGIALSAEATERARRVAGRDEARRMAGAGNTAIVSNRFRAGDSNVTQNMATPLDNQNSAVAGLNRIP